MLKEKEQIENLNLIKISDSQFLKIPLTKFLSFPSIWLCAFEGIFNIL